MTFSTETILKRKPLIAALLVVVTLLIHCNAGAAIKNADKRKHIPAVLNLLLSDAFNFSKSLTIKENDYWGADYQNAVWMSATIRNASGDYISDLTVNDVQLTEYIISKVDGTVKAEAAIDMQTFASSDDEKFGFFPKSTGGQPIDIIFLLDTTGSMADYYTNLRIQITSLINEMIANHVDFRLAVRNFDEAPSLDYNYIDFYGPHEVDLLLNKVALLGNAGGGHVPSTVYDALLNISWFGFRDGARKVCVAVTDIVPQTVYGATWYSLGYTATTRSAAELFLQDLGIELFYAQLDWDPNDIINFYYEKDINPRAGDNSSGFSALRNTAGTPLATKLNFPFDREELKFALGIATPLQVTDNQYLFSWKSSFDKWSIVENLGLIYHPEDYELKVTLKVPDPDQPKPGKFLEESCTYPINKEKVDIVLNVTNEEGTPYTNYGDLSAYLYHKMGGRKLTSAGQLHPDNGKISIINLPKGTYNVIISDSGSTNYSYSHFRAIYREIIEVEKDNMTFNMVVPVADQDAELYKTRGLLKDIGDWRLPGDPFQEMVDNAFVWLNTMESDGLSWEEMAAIKRFYVGLSGFANLIEYSQLEAAGAIVDFRNIVQNFRDIMDAVDKIGTDTKEDFAREVAGGMIDVLLTLIGQAQLVQQKNLLQETVNDLIDYTVEELTKDLRKKIIEQFPLGDYNTLLQIIVNTLVDAEFGDNTLEPDWEPVLIAIRAIAVDQAIETLKEKVSTAAVATIVNTAIEGLQLSDGITEEIKTLLQSILNALISGDIQGNTFSQAIETFAVGLADDVLTVEPDALALVVNNVFDAVEDALDNAGVDPDISDFLLGMTRELTLLAIPEKEYDLFADEVFIKYEMETDKVVQVLVKYGVYYVILKDYCIDDIQAGLEELLDGARTHIPIGVNSWDWTVPMMFDFNDYRGIIGDLQGTAWDAIRVQDAITDWVKQMQQLSSFLDNITTPLDFFANIWPDLQTTADNVHLLIIALDSMQILGNATSFGLKVDSLDTFGNKAELMHQTLFY